MLKLYSYSDRPDLAEQVCQIAQSDVRRRQQTINFDIENYEVKPWTLMYLLKDGKFSEVGSDYLFLCREGRVVCSAGYYTHPEFRYSGERVCVVMSRMYTQPNERLHWYGTIILKEIVKRVDEPYCMVTFNEVNKGLYLSLTSRRRGLVWPKLWHPFFDIGMHVINSTPQWCAVARTSDLLQYVK